MELMQIKKFLPQKIKFTTKIQFLLSFYILLTPYTQEHNWSPAAPRSNDTKITAGSLPEKFLEIVLRRKHKLTKLPIF